MRTIRGTTVVADPAGGVMLHLTGGTAQDSLALIKEAIADRAEPLTLDRHLARLLPESRRWAHSS